MGRSRQHQGGWNQGQQGGWNHPDKKGGQEPKELNREQASVEGNLTNASSSNVRCYRCLDVGHHKADCEKEPVCYKCKQKGHTVVDCKMFKKLKMFGFGIPSQRFYAMDFPESNVKASQDTGLVSILDGGANEEKLDKELKNLVMDKWDFKVRKIDNSEFLVVFPDKGSLETSAKFSSFEMPLYNLRQKITKTERDPRTSSYLHIVWIKVSNIPNIAREIDSMKEVVALVAEPLVVDELSLIREIPSEFKAAAKTNPSAIKGSIEIFFNGVGTFVKFEVESRSGPIKGGNNPPSPGKPDDKLDKSKDFQDKGDKGKRSTRKFDKFGRIDKEGEPSHDGSMEEELEGQTPKSAELGRDNKQMVLPIVAYHPSIGMVNMPAATSGGS